MKQFIHSPAALGQFLTRVRKTKHLTQSELGKAYQLNQTTISGIECGAEKTQLNTLFRLLAALNLEIIIQQKDDVDAYEGVDW